jgi:hypothetical protein
MGQVLVNQAKPMANVFLTVASDVCVFQSANWQNNDG